jgi:D-aminopeptidase
LFWFFAAAALICVAIASAQSRARSRDLGIAPGVFTPGALNAITDVADVRVGHTTIVEGDGVRTGVTAIVPHGGNVFQEKVAGAVFVGNAFGKLAGSTQVAELGTIETPIVLTNTLSVGIAVDAVVRYTLAQRGNEQVRSVNALVGETNDGGLNDIRGLHVATKHVLDAIANAKTGPVAEGSIGAGTGTICYGWKGGIGTSSRKLAPARGSSAAYTVGVLAQTNFGGNLTIGGVPIYKMLQPPSRRRARAGSQSVSDLVSELVSDLVSDSVSESVSDLVSDLVSDPVSDLVSDSVSDPVSDSVSGSTADGSCMLVVATDAPLDARDLRRLAARAVFGLARTGSAYSNGSGDFAIAFSTAPDMRSRFNETAPRSRAILPTDATSPLFEAVLEATEEAVYNSLFQATTTTSRFGTAEAIPLERIREMVKK